MSDAAPPAPPLSRRIVSRYAIGSIGTGGFGTLPGLVLTYYLTDSLGVTALLAGVIVTAAKIVTPDIHTRGSMGVVARARRLSR